MILPDSKFIPIESGQEEEKMEGESFLQKHGIKLGILAVVLVIVGLVVFNQNKTDEESVEPEIVLEPSQQIEEELTMPMSEEEKQAIEDVFSKEGVEMIVLKDVTGGQASGTAWRHSGEEKFYHKTEVSDMPALEKGYFYEGWLVGEGGFFSTGRVMMMDGNGELYYTSEEDKSDYKGVVVTLEQEDGDPAPGEHVLEGSF